MPIAVHDKKDDGQDFLKKHSVGVLATADPNGDPHAAAIYYRVNDQHGVDFLTKADTKKADNLRHNNRAVLVVYNAETQTTVQVTGTVEEITDPLELNKLFEHVIATSQETSGTTLMPLSKLQSGDYVGYKLVPKQIRTAVFSQSQVGGYKDIFATTTS